MSLIKAKYFVKGESFCADDFNNTDRSIDINPNYVMSLSDLHEFRLPLSNGPVGMFATLIMSNGDVYQLRESSYTQLTLDL